ncbi:Imm8 family immunity protein [Brevibacillus dissolubilis]|uniref:Imm8 family immunity protein n=1 Tax=Brevibacillus dissolubilis TaxID=1844116 RepID=UPI001116E9EE|nr:Imm8 family immunity protein [Brevibacillus dissolubilis]
MIVPVLKELVITGDPNLYGELELSSTRDIGDDFRLAGTACIGSRDSLGADFFDFTVITPKRLMKELEGRPVICSRGYVIVRECNLERIRDCINEILKDCHRPTWEEVGWAINRYLHWEYGVVIKYETLDEMKARIEGNE